MMQKTLRLVLGSDGTIDCSSEGRTLLGSMSEERYPAVVMTAAQWDHMGRPARAGVFIIGRAALEDEDTPGRYESLNYALQAASFYVAANGRSQGIEILGEEFVDDNLLAAVSQVTVRRTLNERVSSISVSEKQLAEFAEYLGWQSASKLMNGYLSDKQTYTYVRVPRIAEQIHPTFVDLVRVALGDSLYGMSEAVRLYQREVTGRHYAQDRVTLLASALRQAVGYTMTNIKNAIRVLHDVTDDRYGYDDLRQALYSTQIFKSLHKDLDTAKQLLATAEQMRHQQELQDLDSLFKF